MKNAFIIETGLGLKFLSLSLLTSPPKIRRLERVASQTMLRSCTVGTIFFVEWCFVKLGLVSKPRLKHKMLFIVDFAWNSEH